jgi:hypothetical protein
VGNKRRREKRGYIEKRQWRVTERRNREERWRSTEERYSKRNDEKETDGKRKRGEIRCERHRADRWINEGKETLGMRYRRRDRVEKKKIEERQKEKIKEEKQKRDRGET